MLKHIGDGINKRVLDGVTKEELINMEQRSVKELQNEADYRNKFARKDQIMK